MHKIPADLYWKLKYRQADLETAQARAAHAHAEIARAKAELDAVFADIQRTNALIDFNAHTYRYLDDQCGLLKTGEQSPAAPLMAVASAEEAEG